MTFGGAAIDDRSDAFQSYAAAYGGDVRRSRVLEAVSSGTTFSADLALLPNWLSKIRSILDELGELPINWDSYGAKQISPVLINTAKDILHQLAPHDAPAPSVVPTVDGSVQIEWHTRGIDLEVRLISSARIEVYFEDAIHPERNRDRDEIAYDWTPLKNYMLEIASRPR
jgi:hypothetical protein